MMGRFPIIHAVFQWIVLIAYCGPGIEFLMGKKRFLKTKDIKVDTFLLAYNKISVT